MEESQPSAAAAAAENKLGESTTPKSKQTSNRQRPASKLPQRSKSTKQSSRPNINYKNLDAWIEASAKTVKQEESPASSAANLNVPPALMLPQCRPWDFYGAPPLQNFLPFGGYPYLQQQHDFASLPPNLNLLTSPFSSGMAHSNNGDKLDSDQNRIFSTPEQPNSSLANSEGDDNSGDSKSTSMSKTSLKIDESNLLANDLLPSNLSETAPNNKLITDLFKQITLLHETNTKIVRQLQETKVEVDALKLAPNWGGMRHRRDSISGLSMHSQPLGPIAGSGVGIGGNYGTQSPAPTYHSQGYTPGVVTDVIREVREGSRVREEAMLNRVKSMIEERQWSINETNLRVVRELEELKIQMHQMKLDKKHTDDKLTRLENEVSSLRNLITHSLTYPRQSFGDFGATYADHSVQFRRPNLQQRLSFGGMSDLDARNCNGFEPSSPKRNGRSSLVDEDGSLVEKEALGLRKELQDAIASKKASENKIAHLEKLVSSLKHRTPIISADFVEENQTFSAASPQKANPVQAVSPKPILTNNLTINGPVTEL